MNSALNEYTGLTPVASSAVPVPNPEIPAFPVYDLDEGLKKYQKKVYSELIDVVQSILPEGEEEKSPEELKGYHSKQMSSWKMERT